MDRLHVRLAHPAAAAFAVRAAGVGVSFGPAVPFGPRFWWYDVHQVEGAVQR